VLDIIVLFLVGRHICSIAKRKNRSPVGYVLLLVFGYFGLGVTCGIVAILVAGVDPDQANDNDFIFAALPGVLVGYALGVALAYIVVGAVPPLPKRRFYDDGEYDDYDDYDRPRRRRDEDPYDYEDDRPRGRRDEDSYDHEDDRPRQRRRHEDDEDDDHDRPRRRRDDY
jgi:hypothetical protein